MDQKPFQSVDLSSETQDLNHWIKKLSYRQGEFTLSSGRKSSFYIDLKATTLHPEGIFKISSLMVDRILKLGLSIEAVGGLTLGADPLVTGVSLEGLKRGRHWPAIIVRKEPKAHGAHGTQGIAPYLEGDQNLQPGAAILVLEDVVTTGGSSIQAIQRLRQAGFHPLAVFTVVDREEGGAQEIRKQGVEFFALTTLAQIQNTSL
ncbi:MAG: orotate phosphoribosyltransferase [Bdellovibrionia bacterium]